MPPAPRGSSNLSAATLKKLQAVASQNGKLVYWFPKGQPVPDSILGSVITPRDSLGAAIQKIVAVEGVNVRLDVFPLGIVNPEEFLVSFEQGMGGAR